MSVSVLASETRVNILSNNPYYTKNFAPSGAQGVCVYRAQSVNIHLKGFLTSPFPQRSLSELSRMKPKILRLVLHVVSVLTPLQISKMSPK